MFQLLSALTKQSLICWDRLPGTEFILVPGFDYKLELKQPVTVGNGYRDYSNGSLPATLHEATQLMKQSEVAKEILGEKFIEHFAQTREWEWRQHLKAVTDWEYKRYFEII